MRSADPPPHSRIGLGGNRANVSDHGSPTATTCPAPRTGFHHDEAERVTQLLTDLFAPTLPGTDQGPRRTPGAWVDPLYLQRSHDLTGPAPMSWPEALEVLSAELGEPVTFQVAAERQFLERLTGAGVPAGEAELLITREWAILAGENDYTTGTFQQITGRPPRPAAEFLHHYREEFV